VKHSGWLIAVWALSLVIALAGGHRISTIITRDDPVIVQVSAEEAAALTTTDADLVARSTTDLPPTLQDFVVQTVEMVSQLTGPGAVSRTDERWNIAGTDLGSSFVHNDNIYMVFGDTWGRDGVEGTDWRSNTMVIVEPDPEHGYVVINAIVGEDGEATELLASRKLPKTEYTVIPHAGISIDGRMYLQYMSIRDWEPQGWGYFEPISNGSGFAYSDDHGQTWTKDQTAFWTGNSAFTQTAMVEDGDHVYVFGTPAGRFGPVKLMRVPREKILEPEQYAYWTGSDWRDDPNYAAELAPAPIGELSVRWSPHHDRWLMMYLNDITNTIVLRTAEHLEGPWDEERVVVTASEYPSLYAPFMLPITGPDIYFAMSIFTPGYQVYIMRLRLENDEATSVTGGLQEW
jgi:hypothetical protein